MRQPSQRLFDSINSIYDNDPLILKDAIYRNDMENWKEVVKLKYKLLIDKKTCRLVQLPADRETLEYKWVFKKKLRIDGS